MVGAVTLPMKSRAVPFELLDPRPGGIAIITGTGA